MSIETAGKTVDNTSVDAPLFSIVIPTFNRNSTILRAVESCLNQSFDNWELLVVDDGSTVPTADALTSIVDSRVNCIRLAKNMGVSNARNVGVEHARGRYIAFLDSDDAFTTDKLSTCFAALEKTGFPGDICLGSRIDIRRGAGYSAAIPSSLIEPDESLFGYLFVRGGILSTDTLVVSAELAAHASFRTDLTRHEDYDYMWQLENAGARFIMLPESLATWYDSDDPDRLTRATGYAQSKYWIESIASSLAPDVYAAFQLRILGPLAARENSLGGMRIFSRYLRSAKTMSLKSKIICLLKCSLPDMYTRLTSLYVKAVGRVAA